MIEKLIEDYDLFIASTATAMGYRLVTENVSHMGRLDVIKLRIGLSESGFRIIRQKI